MINVLQFQNKVSQHQPIPQVAFETISSNASQFWSHAVFFLFVILFFARP